MVSPKAATAPKRAFSLMAVILPVLALGLAAGGFLVFNGIDRPVPTEAPDPPTSTSAPASTDTPVPTLAATEAAVVPLDTPTLPPLLTETPAAPSIPVLGGADKIAFAANNEVWLMNVDGSELKQLTTDGAAKNDLQWLDANTLLFLSGKIVKYYKMDTDSVETLTSFPSAVSLDAFQVSHDGSQVILAMSNEVFVVPFDFETLKNVTTRGSLFGMEGACLLPTPKTRAALQVQEARWSADDKLVAWLFKGIDADNASLQADQVSVFDIQSCKAEEIDLLDNFPGTRFNPVGFQNREMPDFDWDGRDLFVFNTSRRNNGWGEMYSYNWRTHRANILNPIDQRCCYRDARWSPDSTYLLFAFQDLGLGAEAPTLLYYVPSGEFGTGARLQPLPLEPGFFQNPREAPQAALRPAQ
jgi:hypothetical protein